MDQTQENTTSSTPTPETVATETQAPVAAATPEQKSGSQMKLAIGAVIIIALAIGGYFLYTKMSVPTVAVVNGTKITEAKLNENIDMMKKSAELQGVDTSDPAVMSEIRSQALENLINNELLTSAARRAGLSTNEAAVQTAYETLVSQVGGEDALKERMSSVGLTDETLKGNITDRLVVDQYIEAETDIEDLSVTDDEIKAYLDSIKTDGIELPSLEEIRPQIEMTLIAEKQQTIVDGLIEKLRSEATIEIKE